jgi:hypothetical protein
MPAWFNDPNHTDPYYIPLALTLAGHYDAALDAVEHYAQSTIPNIAVLWLNSQLFEEKLGDNPRYRDLVRRLATAE